MVIAIGCSTTFVEPTQASAAVGAAPSAMGLVNSATCTSDRHAGVRYSGKGMAAGHVYAEIAIEHQISACFADKPAAKSATVAGKTARVRASGTKEER